ncbi:putative ferric-chelate reductase 1 [Hoplias malabaricus]|uniref:putative ferric-chelate reductase 1 n=1 Tax=Hoplias malabaricus TaxID=27720 RepID=UPI003462EA46
MCVVLLVTMLLCTLRVSWAYSNGLVAVVCDTMTPGHIGTTPQNSTPPFQIRVSNSSYSPGATITVTLEALRNDTPFEGFLLLARTTGSSMAGGYFSSTNNNLFRLLDCFSMKNSAISHSSSAPKTQFEAKWTAPLISVGNITFCATFVHDYTTYWTMVGSNVVSDATVNKVTAVVMCLCVLTALTAISRSLSPF